MGERCADGGDGRRPWDESRLARAGRDHLAGDDDRDDAAGGDAAGAGAIRRRPADGLRGGLPRRVGPGRPARAAALRLGRLQSGFFGWDRAGRPTAAAVLLATAAFELTPLRAG